MSKSSNTQMKIIAIALIVIGAGLAYYGYQMSGSIESQISRAFHGSDTNKVMAFYISGVVSAAIGAYLFIKK